MSWRDEAACKGEPPDIFFPWPSSHSPRDCRPDTANRFMWRAAMACCDRCTVGDECEAEPDDLLSIRNGKAPSERFTPAAPNPCPECGQAFRSVQSLAGHRRQAHGWRPPCGTVPGYRSHRHRDEEPCEACREANRLDVRNRRAEKAAS